MPNLLPLPEDLQAEIAARIQRLGAGEAVDLDGDAELADFFEDIKRRGRQRQAAARGH